MSALSSLLRTHRIESLEEQAADAVHELDEERKKNDRLEAVATDLENKVDAQRDLLVEIRGWLNRHADSFADPQEALRMSIRISKAVS